MLLRSLKMHLPTLSSLHIGGHYTSLEEAQTNGHQQLQWNEICSICLNELYYTSTYGPSRHNHEAVPQQYIETLWCGHAFHTNCIAHWVRHNSSSCPTCKAPITLLDQRTLQESRPELNHPLPTDHLVNESQGISFVNAALDGNINRIRELAPQLGEDRAELGRIAFSVAALYGHVGVLVELRTLGFLIPSEVVVAAFQAAAKEGLVNVIQELIQRYGGHIDPFAHEGAIREAVTHGNALAVVAISKLRIMVRAAWVRALTAAAQGNHVGVMQAIKGLLPTSFPFTKNEWEDTLAAAARHGQVDAVLFIKHELLLWSPLLAIHAMNFAISEAAQGHHHAAIRALVGDNELLLGKGLIYAATNGNAEAVRQILIAKFPSTMYLADAAIVAVRHNYIEVYTEIKTTLKQKKNRRFTDAERSRVLLVAAETGVVEVIDDMLSEIRRKTQWLIGEAVFTAAFHEENLALSTLLHGNPDIFLGWGLLTAAERGNLDVTKFLLEDNVPSQRAVSRVLVHAAQHGHLQYIQWFVMHSGFTFPSIVITMAMQEAHGNQHEAVHQYLETTYHVNQTDFE